jgi:hypothetical protein
VPFDDGRCIVTYSDPGLPRNINRWRQGTSTWDIACGSEVTRCGEMLSCDCAAPVKRQPCPGETLNAIAIRTENGAGRYCVAALFPPRDGACILRGAEGVGGSYVHDWFPRPLELGDSKDLCGHVFACECQTFRCQLDGGL